MNRKLHKSLSYGFVIVFGALAISCPVPPALADKEDDIQEEVDFASGLVDWRFPDYSQKVVDKLQASYGASAKAQVSSVRVKVMTSRGKFDEAKTYIDGQPQDKVETMAMRLALADAYYLWGKLKEARQIYDAFFAKYPSGPPAELKKFYGESAYRYAQMLERVSEHEAAIKAYGYVLLGKLDEDTKYRVMTEKAELMVRFASKAKPDQKKKLLDDAKKLAIDVQWIGPEKLWFWRTVVVLAHVEQLQGDNASARKVIAYYLPQLQGAEDILRENKEDMKMSPIPECRYIMGMLCEDSGRDQIGKNANSPEGLNVMKEALLHYCTVVLKYPASSWAMDSRKRVEGIARYLKGKGRTIKLPNLDNAQFITEQVKEARLLFQKQDFATAIDKFCEILNAYYDRPGLVSPIGELAQCYIESEPKGRQYYARAVTGFIAERYCTNTNLYEEAGSTLLGIAGLYSKRDNRRMVQEVYDLFFDKYPKHKMASLALFRQGESERRMTNYVGAVKYYRQLAERYPGATTYIDALGRTAECYSRIGDRTNAMLWLTNYIARLPAGMEQVSARLRLADEYKLGGQVAYALREYLQLTSFLQKQGSSIVASEDQVEKKKIAEIAAYQTAMCWASLKLPTNKVSLYQTNAIAAYQTFLKDYPKSERASKVWSALGTLFYLLKRTEEADQAFQQLSEKYPDAPESQNVKFVQAKTLMDMGRREEAIRVFGEMIGKPQAYNTSQFLMAGQFMLDAEEYEAASKAFLQVATSTNPVMCQAGSIGVGKSLLGLRQYSEAVKPLEELLVKYPKSGYIVGANQVLSRCYAELGKKEGDQSKAVVWFNKAIKSINIARKWLKEPDEKAQAEIDTAAIQKLMGKKNGAAATYQRILMFADPANQKLRPMIETAFEEGTPLLLEMGMYNEVVNNCENYVKNFPQGKALARAREWRTKASANVVAEPAGSVVAEEPEKTAAVTNAPAGEGASN